MVKLKEKTSIHYGIACMKEEEPQKEKEMYSSTNHIENANHMSMREQGTLRY